MAVHSGHLEFVFKVRHRAQAAQNHAGVGGMNEIVVTWEAPIEPLREDVMLSISNITDTSIELYMVNAVDVYGFQFDLVETARPEEFPNVIGFHNSR